MQNTPSSLPLILGLFPLLIFPIIWLFMMVVGIGGMILWIFMLIHAAEHDIKDKTAWILIIALTNFIGAIIYYFVVKRPYDAEHPSIATQK